MDNILEVKGLCKAYRGFALENVTFSVPRGYIMGFIGPNGTGKTTTIKSILGMVRPDSGEIGLLGQPVADWEASAALKNDVGVVMDLPFYVEQWRVRDVESALAPLYSAWDRAAFAANLRRFALPADKRVKELSRGMKVKLMLAAALSHGAKLLVLDEPTSGLDPVARDELMELLLDFMKDEAHGVLFSTHITADLEKIADYVTYIVGGRLAFTGEKDELMEEYVLVKGGADELPAEAKKLVIGLRAHGAGFDGLVRAADAAKLPAGVVCERPSMDEIMVYQNREGGADE